MIEDKIVITSAVRTPIGSFQGSLSKIKAPDLGSKTIKSAMEKSNLNSRDINEVIMGCVLPAGLGQAPARQAALGAGIEETVGATTINKMCGSGMKATMLAHDSIKAKTNKIVIAGGLENMSNTPYILPKVRDGLRMGHSNILDHMFLDGLEDAYEPGKLMGSFAEDCAESYQFTRDHQDKYAIESLDRARKANDNGYFNNEVCSIKVKTKKEERNITKDEQPFVSDISKIPLLKPAFRVNGTVTAANSSSISDGASSLILMTESEANKRGIAPLARVSR